MFVERILIQGEIENSASAFWRTRNRKGELSLTQLKKELNGKTPFSIVLSAGSYAKTSKIVITR
jgi:hypothetical protein